MHYKMINLDSITNENSKEHNKKGLYFPYDPYRILIIGGSGSRMTNALLNLIKEQDNIDKNYLYEKDLSERNYKFLIKKLEQNISLIQMHLLSVLVQWMTFLRIMMTTTQTKKEKF